MKRIFITSLALLTLTSFVFAKPKKENKNDVETITSSTISIKDSNNNLAGYLVVKATYETKGKPNANANANAHKADKKSAKILFTFDIDAHPNELGDGATLQGDNGLNVSIKRTNIADVTPKKGIVTKTKENVTGNEKKNVQETYQATLSFNDLEKINKAIGGNKSYTFVITTKSGKKLNLVANNTSEIKEIFDELK